MSSASAVDTARNKDVVPPAASAARTPLIAPFAPVEPAGVDPERQDRRDGRPSPGRSLERTGGDAVHGEASMRIFAPLRHRPIAKLWVGQLLSSVGDEVSRIAAVRCYAAGSGLNQEEVTGRILDLLKNFDKVRMNEKRE